MSDQTKSTYNGSKLIQNLACKIANHGAHIKRHVAYIGDHDESLGIVWLILGWIKSKASSSDCCWILQGALAFGLHVAHALLSVPDSTCLQTFCILRSSLYPSILGNP